MSIGNRVFLIGTGIAALSLILTASAGAHGILEGSSIPPNASVASPPRQLVLRFSERVDRNLSTTDVFSEGRKVSGRPDWSGDGRTATVRLQRLQPGLYTVKWRVLSTVDGHTTSGFFVFGVGRPVPQGTTSSGAAGPPIVLVLMRWLALLGGIFAGGSAFFQTFIIERLMRKLETSDRHQLASIVSRPLRRIMTAAALCVLVGAIGQAIFYPLTLLDTSFRQAVGSGAMWSFLTETKAGWSILLLVVMAAILMIPPTPSGRVFRMASTIWAIVAGLLVVLLLNPSTVAASRHGLHFVALLLVATVYGLISVIGVLILPLVPDLRLPDAKWAAPLAGALLLGSFTISSHAAGIGPLAMLIDYIHVLAAAAWVGGLATYTVVLATAPKGARQDVSTWLVAPFSRLSGVSLAVIVLSGTYSAWIHIPELRAFTLTTYGQLLLLKLVLAVLLVALGAYNRFILRPRLQWQTTGPWVYRFGRSIGAEAALGAGILLVVAALTATPPAAVAMRTPAEPLHLVGEAGAYAVRLYIRPAAPGWNRFEVVVTDRSGRLLESEDRVIVRTMKLDEDLAPETTTLQKVNGGRFEVEGGQLALPGWWEVEVVVRRKGMLDVATSFPVLFRTDARHPADPKADQLLLKAQRTMGSIQSWRETQQITDGVGGMVATVFDAVRPNRLRYRTSGGAEAIIIGSMQYIRNGPREQWQLNRTATPLALEGPMLEFFSKWQDAALGRRVACGEEDCVIALWRAPGGSAAFAGWIGLGTMRMHRVLMVAPSHLMTAKLAAVNQPVNITPP